MVNRERKLVGKEITSLYVDGITAKNVIAELQGYIDKYGDSVSLHKATEAYSDHEYIAVCVQALEDDKQYAKRIEQEEYYENLREQRDRAEFERLQKKFNIEK